MKVAKLLVVLFVFLSCCLQVTAIQKISTLIPRIINKKQVIHAAFSMIC